MIVTVNVSAGLTGSARLSGSSLGLGSARCCFDFTELELQVEINQWRPPRPQIRRNGEARRFSCPPESESEPESNWASDRVMIASDGLVAR
jgi:hypothetical protein